MWTTSTGMETRFSRLRTVVQAAKEMRRQQLTIASSSLDGTPAPSVRASPPRQPHPSTRCLPPRRPPQRPRSGTSSTPRCVPSPLTSSPRVASSSTSAAAGSAGRTLSHFRSASWTPSFYTLGRLAAPPCDRRALQAHPPDRRSAAHHLAHRRVWDANAAGAAGN